MSRRRWDGLCPAGRHGLDFKSQPCDRCAASARRFVFVGECRSLTAIRKGWSWEDGRLAAKPLFEALAAMEIDLARCEFGNLFHDPKDGGSDREVNPSILVALHILTECKDASRRRIVVALGQRVSKALTEHGVEHVALVHPAARGRIRKRSRYIAHVSSTLRAA